MHYVMCKLACYVAETTKMAQGKKPSLTPERMVKLLEAYGVDNGTKHKRIFIPYDKLTPKDAKNIGFRFTVGIPERGGSIIRSYRHAPTRLHIHKHKTGWTVHRDEHPVSLKHTIKEGIPAIYYNLIKARGDMEDVIRSKDTGLSLKLKRSADAIT